MGIDPSDPVKIKKHIPMLNDPAMTVMLIKKLLNENRDLCLITDGREAGNSVVFEFVEMDQVEGVAHENLERAAAEAFAKAKGLI